MTVASMTVLASPPGATWGLVSCPKTNMDRVRSNCQPRGYRMTLISSNEAIVDLLMIKCSIGLLILLKTCNQRYCFSCNETFSPSPHETGIWGFEAAFAIFSRMIAEWWHHALTKVTPQVLKSSTCVFSFPPCLSFISSPPLLICIHPPRLFICTISLLITCFFHLLSNDLWDWFDPQTSSLLFPSRRSVSLALFLIVCLFYFFTLSHFYAHLAAFFLTLPFSFVPVLLSSYTSFSPLFCLFPFIYFYLIQNISFYFCLSCFSIHSLHLQMKERHHVGLLLDHTSKFLLLLPKLSAWSGQPFRSCYLCYCIYGPCSLAFLLWPSHHLLLSCLPSL